MIKEVIAVIASEPVRSIDSHIDEVTGLGTTDAVGTAGADAGLLQARPAPAPTLALAAPPAVG